MDLPEPKPLSVTIQLKGRDAIVFERYARNLAMTPGALARQIIKEWLTKYS